MAASPIVQVKDGSGSFVETAGGVDVTPGNTISIRLKVTTDVSQWTLQVFGVDEVTSTAPSLTGVNPTTHVVTSPTTVVTFTMPAGAGVGRSLVFRSSVNGGGAAFTTSFGVYVLTGGGYRVGAVGEKLEGDETFGWASTVNRIIRDVGSTPATLPELAGTQYAVLMEDPVGTLVFQPLTEDMLPDLGGGGGGNISAYDLVFNPTGIQEDNVYTDFGDLVDAANDLVGTVRVGIVDMSPVAISSGTYNLSNIIFSRAGTSVPEFIFEGSAEISLPLILDDVKFTTNKTTGSVCTLSGESLLRLTRNASITATYEDGVLPFLDLAGNNLTIRMDYGASIQGASDVGIVTSDPEGGILTLQTPTLRDLSRVTRDTSVDVVLEGVDVNIDMMGYIYTAFPFSRSVSENIQTSLLTLKALPGGESRPIYIITGDGGPNIGGSGAGPSGPIEISTGLGVNSVGTQGPSVSGDLTIKTGNGGNIVSGYTGFGAASGNITIRSGFGGNGGTTTSGGNAGDVRLWGGNGGFDGGAGGGGGGDIQILGGLGGESTTNVAGSGGNVQIGAGRGGLGVNDGTGGGVGGNVSLYTGEGGPGAGTPANGNGVGPGGSGGYMEIYTGIGGVGTVTGAAGAGGDIAISTGDGGIGYGGGAGNGGSLSIACGDGGLSNDEGIAGDGGSITIDAGRGGNGNPNASGGLGGSLSFSAGNGGADDGVGAGNGGVVEIYAGNAADSSSGPAGIGGSVLIAAGDGGDGTGSEVAGDGGILDLRAGGAGEDGGGGEGVQGFVRLVPVNNAITSPELRFQNRDGTNYVGLRAPNLGGGDVTYQLPSADGNPGDVLTTSGSGVLSWEVAGSGGSGTSFSVTQSLTSNDPETIYTYTDSGLESRATIFIEASVTTIGYQGIYASFKLVATFTRNLNTITEREVLVLNGPARSDPNLDVIFDISGRDVLLQVVGVNQPQEWRAVGTVTYVEATYAEA